MLIGMGAWGHGPIGMELNVSESNNCQHINMLSFFSLLHLHILSSFTGQYSVSHNALGIGVESKEMGGGKNVKKRGTVPYNNGLRRATKVPDLTATLLLTKHYTL